MEIVGNHFRYFVLQTLVGTYTTSEAQPFVLRKAYSSAVSKASTIVRKLLGSAGYPKQFSHVLCIVAIIILILLHLCMCSHDGGSGDWHSGHLSGTGGGHALRQRMCHHLLNPDCGNDAVAIHPHGSAGCLGRPSSNFFERAGVTI
jgi:hypothetical protein